MRMKKEKRGITLIALVITIIVLLILAGVSIATIMGDDGIIAKAKDAAEKNEIEAYLEEVKLKLSNYNMNNSIGDSDEYIDAALEGFEYVKSGSDEKGYYDILTYKERKVKVYFNENNNVSEVELVESIPDGVIYKKTAGTYGIDTSGLLYDFEQTACLNDNDTEALYGVFAIDLAVSMSDWWDREAGSIYVVDRLGKVYAWGDNSCGQLGDGTLTSATEPICINDISGSPLNDVKIKSISISAETVAAIDENGKVWTWGDNTYGQLADGSTEDSSVPFCVNDDLDYLADVKFASVSAGAGHVLAIDESGKIWTWGKNDYGQLGNNGQEDLTEPICINELSGNTLNGVTIKKVAAGEVTSAAIDASGNLWIWGKFTGRDSWGGTNTPQPLPVCLNNVENGIVFSDVINRADIAVLTDTNKNLYGCMILNGNYCIANIKINGEYTSLFPRESINQVTIMNGIVKLLGDGVIIDTDGNANSMDIDLAL